MPQVVRCGRFEGLRVRILIVDRNDSPDCGPWAQQEWDQVMDMGKGGRDSYSRWTRHFGCAVIPLDPYELACWNIAALAKSSKVAAADSLIAAAWTGGN